MIARLMARVQNYGIATPVSKENDVVIEKEIETILKGEKIAIHYESAK
jgi:hypothetical protein